MGNKLSSDKKKSDDDIPRTIIAYETLLINRLKLLHTELDSQIGLKLLTAPFRKQNYLTEVNPKIFLLNRPPFLSKQIRARIIRLDNYKISQLKNEKQKLLNVNFSHNSSAKLLQATSNCEGRNQSVLSELRPDTTHAILKRRKTLDSHFVMSQLPSRHSSKSMRRRSRDKCDFILDPFVVTKMNQLQLEIQSQQALTKNLEFQLSDVQNENNELKKRIRVLADMNLPSKIPVMQTSFSFTPISPLETSLASQPSSSNSSTQTEGIDVTEDSPENLFSITKSVSLLREALHKSFRYSFTDSTCSSTESLDSVSSKISRSSSVLSSVIESGLSEKYAIAIQNVGYWKNKYEETMAVNENLESEIVELREKIREILLLNQK
ncbi:hypothetical protein BKA69DRAFT_1172359 [Paraphysoderma sedebokerense]|nr:hypothetical protein BKA69DRAFT_1172359 [Paraphysoderma sedebokerense]